MRIRDVNDLEGLDVAAGPVRGRHGRVRVQVGDVQGPVVQGAPVVGALAFESLLKKNVRRLAHVDVHEIQS